MTMMMALLGSAGPSLEVDYPATVSTSGGGFSTCGTTTPTQVGAPTILNGSGTYTYLWEHLSGDTFSLNSTTVQRPQFSTFACDGVIEQGVYQVTVTDTVTGDVATDTVTIDGSWINLT